MEPEKSKARKARRLTAAEINDDDELELVYSVTVRRKSDGSVVGEGVSHQEVPPFSEYGFSTYEEAQGTYGKLASPMLAGQKEAVRRALEDVMSKVSKKVKDPVRRGFNGEFGPVSAEVERSLSNTLSPKATIMSP
ncbi:MAG: hypothetical protein IJ161_12360 [Bacteroidales bacterium]|nr:hypothetical protein [Bacteroidales bacterium]